jgi:GT2 family glycosyltransferase
VSQNTHGVSIVVPNWNGRDLLRANVPGWLAAVRAFPGEAELVVVDDGSTDDSVQLLRELGVEAVVHPKNAGFAAACLTGAKAANHAIVVLLNSDVVAIDEKFLAPLVVPFARDPSVFAVAPLVLDKKGEVAKISVNLPRVRRGELKWDGVDAGRLLDLAKLPAETPLEIPTLFPLGGAVALDRARFLALGGFDPIFRPFYHEDTDLGLAAWTRGWRCLVEPRSRVRHDDGGTIAKHFKRFKVKVAKRRHRLLLTWKRASGAWLRAHLFFLFVKLATRWLKLDARFYVAFFQALGRLREARRSRARERAEKKVGLEDVFATIRAGWPPAV